MSVYDLTYDETVMLLFLVFCLSVYDLTHDETVMLLFLVICLILILFLCWRFYKKLSVLSEGSSAEESSLEAIKFDKPKTEKQILDWEQGFNEGIDEGVKRFFTPSELELLKNILDELDKTGNYFMDDITETKPIEALLKKLSEVSK